MVVEYYLFTNCSIIMLLNFDIAFFHTVLLQIMMYYYIQFVPTLLKMLDHCCVRMEYDINYCS